MIISRLLDLWDQATNDFDNAMDYSDYNLANSIENYLDMLAEEIDFFTRCI
jgi:hypothetical protein